MKGGKSRRSAWDSYRFWRKVFRWGVLFSVVIVGLLEFTSLAGAFPSWIFLVGLGGALATWPCMLWSCPRCGNPFFYKLEFFMPYKAWAKECRHCGLTKWKEPEPVGMSALPRRSPVPDPEITRRAKHEAFLKLVLRDDPGAIGLKPDADGWVSEDELLRRAGKYNVDIRREDLDRMVCGEGTGGTQRSASGGRIRLGRGEKP